MTDKVLESAGVVEPIKQFVEHANAELLIFNEGEIEPSTETVARAASGAKDFQPDLFVGLGGGSNMDLAKACSAVTAMDAEVETLFGFDNVPRSVRFGATPLVCIPTTSGTGSEVSHTCVLRNSSTGQRSTILSQCIRPDVAIVDPYLSVSCPQKVTAESGMAALTHAIEAFLVANFFSFHEESASGLAYEGNNPFGDMYAEKAIELIGKSLRRSVEEPEDIAARTGMSLGATLAGAASSNCGVGLAHALEQPIRSKFGCSHGVAKGIVLPEVMRYVAAPRLNRVAKIAKLLGEDTTELAMEDAAMLAVKSIVDLRIAIGMPARLSELGAESTDLPVLAEAAFGHQQVIHLSPNSPSVADIVNILKASL